jgi:FkbM family methyltransferase
MTFEHAKGEAQGVSTASRAARRILGIGLSLLTYYRPRMPSRTLARFYAPMVGPGDLFFDVGAHVGGRIRAGLRLRARVVAVEPHPYCMTVLRWMYRDHPQVTLIERAVGPTPATRTLWMSLLHPSVSSLSLEWIQAVQKTSGFAHVRWEEPISVEVTTLDALIDQHGEPDFCKIDVEGYELGVLQGLSMALPLLSFEYTPAAIGIAAACIDRLGELGPYEYNRSEGEAARFASAHWLAPRTMVEQLRRISPEARSGDVYARRRQSLHPS